MPVRQKQKKNFGIREKDGNGIIDIETGKKVGSAVETVDNEAADDAKKLNQLTFTGGGLFGGGPNRANINKFFHEGAQLIPKFMKMGAKYEARSKALGSITAQLYNRIEFKRLIKKRNSCRIST